MKTTTSLILTLTALTLAAAPAIAQAPPNVVANPDTIVTNSFRTPVSINNLLVNDTDLENDPLTILNVTQPQDGRTELKPGNIVVYTPGRGFTGVDTFTYRINDRPNGLGNSALGIVTIRNPFVLGKGGYASAFSGANGTHDVSGFFNSRVDGAGNFSATLRLDGQPFRFRGKFDISGNFSGDINRTGGLSDVQIALQYAVNGNTRQVAGTITIGAQTIQFTAPRSPWSLRSQPTRTGRYTLALPAPNTATTTPQGTGFVTMVVSKLGVVSAVGRTGDDRGFSSLTLLAPNGTTVPVYGIARNRGSLYGNLELTTAVRASNAAGNLRWFKARNTKDDLFPNGFDLTVAASGGSYFEPASNSSVLATNNTATFNSNFTASLGNLRSPRSERALVGRRPLAGPYEVTFDNTKRLAARFTVNARTGFFSGSFYDSATRLTRRMSGVVLQGTNRAAGVWHSPTRSGKVELQPDALNN